jgi:hypothetical protein
MKREANVPIAIFASANGHYVIEPFEVRDVRRVLPRLHFVADFEFTFHDLSKLKVLRCCFVLQIYNIKNEKSSV